MQLLQGGPGFLLVIGMLRDVVPYNSELIFFLFTRARVCGKLFRLRACLRPKLDDEYQENANHQT